MELRTEIRHRARQIAATGLVFLFLLTPALAVQPDEILPDPGLEARARAISAGLRCLVCQNQSIDDSDAPLARDLRLLVRERLQAGDSDAAVESYLVQRYGEFVLLKPPFGWHTLLLWAMPLAALIAALWAAARGMGWQHASPEVSSRARLSKDEEARLKVVLKSEGP